MYVLNIVASVKKLNSVDLNSLWLRGKLHSVTPKCETPILSAKPINSQLTCDEIEDLIQRNLHQKIRQTNYREYFTAEWRGRSILISRPKGTADKNFNQDKVRREILALGFLNSSYFVKLIGHCEQKIVTEWFPQTLENILLNHDDPLPISRILQIAVAIANGVRNMHNQVDGTLVHANIQPDNVFISSDGTIKIGGLNRVWLVARDISGENCPFHLPLHQSVWQAPEEYKGKHLTAKIDVYSMGLVFWSLLSRKAPFQGMSNGKLAKYIALGGRPAFEVTWPQNFSNLVQKMLSHDPSNRPSAQAVVESLMRLTDVQVHARPVKVQSATKTDTNAMQAVVHRAKLAIPQEGARPRKILDVLDAANKTGQVPGVRIVPGVQIVPDVPESVPEQKVAPKVPAEPEQKERQKVAKLKAEEFFEARRKDLRKVPMPPPPENDVQADNGSIGEAMSTKVAGECSPIVFDRSKIPGKIDCRKIDKLKLEGVELGKGSMQDAFRLRWGTQDILRKTIRKRERDESKIQRQHMEAEALALVDGHPNIVRFLGWCSPHLFTEWMPLSLEEVVLSQTNVKIPYKRVLLIAKDMVSSIRALHEAGEKRIALTRIQLGRFYADFDGTVKLGSLSSSKFIPMHSNGTACPWKRTESYFGRWNSPEAFTEMALLTEKTDIYSLGLVFWTLLARQKPFPETAADNVRQRVLDGDRPKIEAKWPSGFASLMQRCWEADPSKRPSAKEVSDVLDALLEDEKESVDNFRFEFHDEEEHPKRADVDSYDGDCEGEEWYNNNPLGEISCVDIDELVLSGKSIGEGNWREVFSSFWKGEKVAVKYMKDDQERSQRNLDRHRREAVVLSLLQDNPNVVKLLGRCDYHMVTEWMPLQLGALLTSQPQVHIPYSQVLHIALGIAKGIAALHNLPGGPVAHTDIQGDQFFIGFDGTVKISDFNRCRFVRHKPDGSACPFVIHSNQGSARSPEEYVKYHPLTEKVDLYSTSLLFWGLLSRRHPFEDMKDENIYRFVRKGGRPHLDKEWPSEFVSLIERMWTQNAEERPSANQIVSTLTAMIEKLNASEQNFKLDFSYESAETDVAKANTCWLSSWASNIAPQKGQLGCNSFNLMIRSGERIAVGYWREVHAAEWEGRPLAVKVLKEKHKKRRENIEAHNREIIALSLLQNHSNVVQYVGRCEQDIITELLPLTLDEVVFDLDSFPSIPYTNTLGLALSAAKGVQALHEVEGGPIVHTNIMIFQFLVASNWELKINDLNRCRFVAHREDGTACPFHSDENEHIWRAPEQCEDFGLALTEKIDIYSMGLVFWTLMSRELPFQEMETLLSTIEAVKDGKRPAIPDSWPKEYAELVEQLWHQDPAERPSVGKVVATLERLLASQEAIEPRVMLDQSKAINKKLKAREEEKKEHYVQSMDDKECLGAPWWHMDPQGEIGCKEIQAMMPTAKKIGEGYWRDVYAAEWNGKKIVIKYMKDEHELTQRNADRHMREAIGLAMLADNPNVVHFLGRCNFDIATEWMPLSLDAIIFDTDKYPELPYAITLKLARDVARGVQAIHNLPGGALVHADIQARQFLLDYDGTVKINDLNRCRFQPHYPDGSQCPFYIYDHGGNWRSPEEYTRDSPLNEKLDVFSMALVIWSLMSRQEPFFEEKSYAEVHRLVRNGKRPAIDEQWPKEFGKLLEDLWEQKPSDRISAEEAANRLDEMLVAEMKKNYTREKFELKFE